MDRSLLLLRNSVPLSLHLSSLLSSFPLNTGRPSISLFLPFLLLQISNLLNYLLNGVLSPTNPPHPATIIHRPLRCAPSSEPPVATPAFRSFINRLHDQIKDGLSQRRPWAKLVDRYAFSKPESLSEASTRVRKNYSYFRVNYLSLLALSLVFHPFSLLTLVVLLAAWFFLFKPSDQPLVLFGRSFSDKETLGILVVVSVFVVFLTNVGSGLMSVLVVGLGIVSAHGAFRVPEDLFLDDQDTAVSTSFLSFLGATTATTVAPRV